MCSLHVGTLKRFANAHGSLRALNHGLRIRTAIRGIMKKALIAILVFLILFFSMQQIASRALQSSTVQFTLQGKIAYNFGDLTLKFFTDFENVSTWDKPESHYWHLTDLGISNSFVTDPDGYGNAWIEGLEVNTPGFVQLSGSSRCIGISIASGTGGLVKRAEFNIHHLQNYFGDEYYISFWTYWGNDFLDLNVGGNNWAGIGSPYFTGTGYQPWGEIGLERPYPYGANDFRIYLKNAFQVPPGNGEFLGTVDPFDLVQYRGAWHYIEWYCKRSISPEGIFKYWIDGDLILNCSGFINQHTTIDEWYLTCLKLYMDAAQTNGMRIWIDNLKIYS